MFFLTIFYCPCNGSGFGSATSKILGNFTVWKHGCYHSAEAIRTRKWHIVVNYIQCPKCLCPNHIVVGRQRFSKLSDGAICFFALHRAAMLCSRYVFLDVVHSTSCNAKISRTNATIRIFISFFWRFDKILSFLVLFFKCLISASSIWSRCRGGRSHFQIRFFQTFTKNSRTADMCLLQWPPL